MNQEIASITDIIKKNHITAFNYSRSNNSSVCFNFIELPNTKDVILTVTMMKNKKKTISLDSKSFAKAMGIIESRLDNLLSEEDCDFPYFSSIHNQLNRGIYHSLKCHRMFVIPEYLLFDTVKVLSSVNAMEQLKLSCSIEEISLYVRTTSHSLKITKFKEA